MDQSPVNVQTKSPESFLKILKISKKIFKIFKRIRKISKDLENVKKFLKIFKRVRKISKDEFSKINKFSKSQKRLLNLKKTKFSISFSDWKNSKRLIFVDTMVFWKKNRKIREHKCKVPGRLIASFPGKTGSLGSSENFTGCYQKACASGKTLQITRKELGNFFSPNENVANFSN